MAQRIAGLGLGEQAAISIAAVDNDMVLHELRLERLEGLVVSGLGDGSVEADDEFSSAVVRRHDEMMAQNLTSEIASIRVSELLDAQGLRHRILKGPSIAHTVARNPSERPYQDVDVLVTSSHIDDAVGTLERAGANRLRPKLRHDFDSRFAKSVTMTLGGVELDVHRTLCPGPFGVWMFPEDLFLLGSSIDLGGHALPTLDSTDQLVHACYHAALGSHTPSLLNLRDIVLLANERWDAERFSQTIDRWKGRPVIQRAVAHVRGNLGVDIPPELARFETIAVDPKQAAALEPYSTTDTRGRLAALAPATLRALPLRDRPAFARAVGLPDGVELAGRLRSLVDRTR